MDDEKLEELRQTAAESRKMAVDMETASLPRDHRVIGSIAGCEMIKVGLIQTPKKKVEYTSSNCSFDFYTVDCKQVSKNSLMENALLRYKADARFKNSNPAKMPVIDVLIEDPVKVCTSIPTFSCTEEEMQNGMCLGS